MILNGINKYLLTCEHTVETFSLACFERLDNWILQIRLLEENINI